MTIAEVTNTCKGSMLWHAAHSSKGFRSIIFISEANGKVDMRIVIIALVLAVLIAACGGRVDRESRSFVQQNTNTVDAPQRTAPAPNYQIISAGKFGYNTHHVAGAALVINNGSRALLLQNFQTESRPDLHIYIMLDGAESDIGLLTAYVGNITLPVPQGSITQVTLKSGSTILATAQLS